MYDNLPCPTLQTTPNVNNLHHKTDNADNVSQTNYCKCGHLHFFIIIVHVKSVLRTIAQIEYISMHISYLAEEQTNQARCVRYKEGRQLPSLISQYMTHKLIILKFPESVSSCVHLDGTHIGSHFRKYAMQLGTSFSGNNMFSISSKV